MKKLLFIAACLSLTGCIPEPRTDIKTFKLKVDYLNGKTDTITLEGSDIFLSEGNLYNGLSFKPKACYVTRFVVLD